MSTRSEKNYLKRLSLDDISVSEKDKNGEKYLMAMTDHFISLLVREKPEIKKCRDLYDGKRDKKEFKYLEDTYGVTAVTLKMTPIVKPRVNALIGSMINQSIRHVVSYSDIESIDTVNQEKKDKHIAEVTKLLQMQMQHNSQMLQKGEEPENKYFSEDIIKKLKRSYTSGFVSDIEKSAYYLLNYFMKSPRMEFERKREQLDEDLCVTGEAYFRVFKSETSEDPVFEVKKPENMFFNVNTNDANLRNCDAVVCREFMTRRQILYKYGQYMTKADLDDIYKGSSEIMLGARYDSLPQMDQKIIGTEDDLKRQFSTDEADVLEVFHVEWIANNKVEKIDGKWKWRQDRYTSIRIGTELYLNMGKDDTLVRSKSEPYRASLTYDGIIYKGRNGKAQSIAWSLKDAQDMYDIIMFYRDNLIATSGVDAARINIAAIPTALGDEFMPRLLAFLALRKTNGVELIDPSQEDANLFQHYGSSKNSVDPNLIVSMDTILQSIEKQADIIAGTNQQMLAQIAQKDAVENVKVGMNQVMLINKPLFLSESELLKNISTKLIDTGKICYMEGKKGSYLVGAVNCTFKIDPKNYCYTDYAVTISDDSKEIAKLEGLKALLSELAGAGVVPPEVIIKASIMDSISAISELVEDAMMDAKAEGGQAQQQEQQLEQAKQQIDQLTKELEKAKGQIDTQSGDNLKAEELKAKVQEITSKIANEKRKLDLEERKILEELALKRETVQLERDQIYAPQGTVQGNAREVKNM